MPSKATWFKTLRRILLIWLAANICIVSIPRCDALFSQWLNESQEVEHCHPQTLSEGPVLQTSHLCKCTLLSFVFSVVQWSDAQHIICAPDSLPALATFDYRASPSDISLETEFPPPKV